MVGGMKTTQLDGTAYQSAEMLLRHNRAKLVLGGKVRPQWIAGGARFWYAVDTSAGRRFILVDPKAGTREPAFDHSRLAAALAAASGQDVATAELPFGAIELAGGAVEFDAFGAHWRCLLDTYACAKAQGTPPGNPLEVPSPDKKLAVFLRGRDLWARSLEDGREWPLTSDGDVDHGYGANPDYLMYSPLVKRIGLPHMPPALAWSPDSTRVLTHRTDQTGVRQTHWVESMPGDGGAPRLHTQRYAFPGDDRLPLAEFVVLDIAEGTAVPAQAEPVADLVTSLPEVGLVGRGRLGENAEYVIDSASTIETPPVTSVRGWDGRVIVELERADITRLTATGWTPPERFRATAADGKTDIYGVLYRPPGFDPDRRYPVIDHVYPSPAFTRVSPSFDAGWHGYDAEAVASLGFVVVAMDGRGTPGRDKAFHDAWTAAGCLSDHVAALRQLAATRPWMDLDRVGTFGISGGGLSAVRAMMDFPDVYKVGVAESGNHDNRYYYLGWVETYYGTASAGAWAQSSNVDIADRLQGKLLLVHGGMDNNVYLDHTLRLADRLIAADKDFDLLIVPGAEHVYVGYEHYVNRRKWDFLVRHLMGIEPPAGYRLSPVPMDMESLAGAFG